jgi:hypothetical protein
MPTTQSRRKSLQRGLANFFFGGVCSGLLFTIVVTRPHLLRLWFYTQEFWILPTWKLWLLTIGMFLVGLALGYALSHFGGIVAFPSSRLVSGLTLLGATALLPGLFVRSSDPIIQFVMTRLILASLLSVSLFAVTRQYYVVLAIFILVVIIVAPLVASLPDGFIKSFPNEWFEALKFVIASTLLCVLSGYWLIVSSGNR